LARVLIVGCGCRGQALARALAAEGHPARGTTRDPARLPAIEAAGAEPVLADPARLATLTPHLDGISVLCWLLGSAEGDGVAALHAERLDTIVEHIVDTLVRGVVYEGAGTVDPASLAVGGEVVRRAEETYRMPVAVLEQQPADHDAWLLAAVAGVRHVLDT
jgi:uncharacterized protein YbjT (DUF2867 family)